MLNICISPSDWIQIVIAIITLFGIVVSLIISVLTLRQNNKMIEETTRPNIIIYKDTLNISSSIEYLVFKNVGSSLAHISSLSCDYEKIKKLKFHSYDITSSIVGLSNSYIAPQQTFRIPILTTNIDFDTIDFAIKYSNGTKKYKEKFTIFLKQDSSIPVLKHENKDQLKIISNAIQELIKRIT